MRSRHSQLGFSRVTRWARLVAIIGLMLLGPAASGHARTATLRWLDPNPDPSPVAGFRLYVGTESRIYDLSYDIGLPNADESGIRTGSAIIPDNVDVYVAMSAYAEDGRESPLSNEKVWLATPAEPGANAAPQGVIDSPPGPLAITAGMSLVFAGSGSDPDGHVPLTYSWDFDGAGTSSAEDPGAVRFDTPGSYDVVLVVTDSQGLADPTPATVTITVQGDTPAGPPPDAVIDEPSKTVTITAGESVFFSGSAEGGTPPITFEWSFDVGRSGVPGSTLAEPGDVTFDVPGSFTILLRVRDADNRIDVMPAAAMVIVESADEPEPLPIGNGSFPPSESVEVERIASGLASPVYLTAPLGDPRLFVAEAGGVIRIIDDGAVLATPFLDMGFASPGQELLSFAFDPEYAKNGAFYVHWIDSDGSAVLSRFEVGADADVADPSSEEVLLTVPQPFDSQNGGAIAFSPQDGFLYIGMGDGGSTNDPSNVSQDGGELLGKLLRIDVSRPPASGSIPAGGYAIPADNPFVGSPGVRDEIWAFGVRNPYRFSFDRDLGDLWLADEGQDLREEINFEATGSAGGKNYGWDVMEGTECAALPAPWPPCGDDSLTPPFHQYEHDDDACSITGGYVYRGSDDTLYGEYFYGDYCSGAIWSIDRNTGLGTNWTAAFGDAAGKRLEIASFGEGGGGALYVLHENGDVFRIGSVAPACSDQLDNDGDSMIDIGSDPGCRNQNSDIEDPVCNDGLDNDGDNMIDVLDPECSAAWATAEDDSAAADDDDGGGGGGSCGLGGELVFLLPPMMWLRRRRRTHDEPEPRLSRFTLDRNG